LHDALLNEDSVSGFIGAHDDVAPGLPLASRTVPRTKYCAVLAPPFCGLVLAAFLVRGVAGGLGVGAALRGAGDLVCVGFATRFALVAAAGFLDLIVFSPAILFLAISRLPFLFLDSLPAQVVMRLAADVLRKAEQIYVVTH
jgi:hypothetical protein